MVCGIVENRKWFDSHTCKVAGLPLLLLVHATLWGYLLQEIKKKKEEDNYSRPVESQSLSCIRRRIPFQGCCVEPAGPPCAAPFKGRDDQAARCSQTPSQRSLQCIEAGCVPARHSDAGYQEVTHQVFLFFFLLNSRKNNGETHTGARRSEANTRPDSTGTLERREARPTLGFTVENKNTSPCVVRRHGQKPTQSQNI